MTIKIAFYTLGDTRSVPASTDAPTTGRRPRGARAREPHAYANQSEQWAAYATRVVGSRAHVYGVNGTAHAAAVVRQLQNASLDTVYFVGHGFGGYYFRVNTTLTDSMGNGTIAGPPSAVLASPWQTATLFAANDSLRFVQALAGKLRARGGARLEFRCCNMSQATVEGVARALVYHAPDRTVRALGYLAELQLALQSGNQWRAALGRANGSVIPGTTVYGTTAPRFQIDVRARVVDGVAVAQP
ncbi:MAG: hypothetical protein K8H88_06040, partial [Sandaracinaceae bacterium]|nr:hypothetical protein [Sandaracinaceae bacterium]